jgi:hypothetical protein
VFRLLLLAIAAIFRPKTLLTARSSQNPYLADCITFTGAPHDGPYFCALQPIDSRRSLPPSRYLSRDSLPPATVTYRYKPPVSDSLWACPPFAPCVSGRLST